VFLAAATSASHGPPLAAVCVSLAICIAVLVRVGYGRCVAWRASRMLARCPRCGERAVRRMQAEAVDLTRERVALQCGVCDTWRRTIVGDGYRRTRERRFARDRVRIEQWLTAVEQRRPS